MRRLIILAVTQSAFLCGGQALLKLGLATVPEALRPVLLHIYAGPLL